MKVMNKVIFTAKKHSPEILTGIGIAGMITGTILAVKATPKALDIIADIKNTTDENDKKETAKRITKRVFPCYIPAVVASLGGATCIIASTKVSLRRNAALAAAYTMAEDSLIRYQNKVTELFGEKKAKQVEQSIAEDRLKENPISKENELYFASQEGMWVYEPISKIYFKVGVNKLDAYLNNINFRLNQERYLSLNEIWDELEITSLIKKLGLDETIGNQLGYNVDWGLMSFGSCYGAKDDNIPCRIIDYGRNIPRSGYKDTW